MLKKFYSKIKKRAKWFFIGGTALAAVGGGVLAFPNEYQTVNEVILAEETYYQINGKYLQILPGNNLPHYETGTVSGKLGKNVPANVRIDVYETFDGKRGYQISYEDTNAFYSIANGTQAQERTFTKLKPLPVASTTP